jgi:colanic acid biosynthesis glycosyl transferase WcaI
MPISPPATLFTDASQPTVVVFSQVYVPDPASVGQHMHDVAVELVGRGFRVIVFTSDRGYENPSQRFSRYELRAGVHVVRLPLASFGKRNLPLRLLGAGVFLLEALALALALRRIDRVLVSTSPPMCAAAGLALNRARGIAFDYWIMDLNPDQIVALGGLAADAPPVRALDWLNTEALERAAHVVTLDRFMAERVRAKRDVGDKLRVLPPWPHVHTDAALPERSTSPFREEHDFGDARVVMYSGNLSPVHPVTTLLDAAQQLQDARLHDAPRLLFVFVGGGAGREQIERAILERRMANLRVLPYQPIAALPESLSAADVHVVTMGNAMVGIAHPSKIYGAMAVGRPILAFAPKTSHVAELVTSERLGWVIAHGDVEGAVRALSEIATAPDAILAEMGARARDVVRSRFDRDALIERFCDALELRSVR